MPMRGETTHEPARICHNDGSYVRCSKQRGTGSKTEPSKEPRIALKISIITAVFNSEKTVGQALASVASKGHRDLEHIVVDGASTDSTLMEVRKWARPEMHVISEPDNGIYDALNKGIAASTGDVIGLMHCDDFFAYDDVLSDLAYRFEETGVAAVYGDLDYISASDPDKIVRHWAAGTYSCRKLARGWMPPHPMLFVRREVI